MKAETWIFGVNTVFFGLVAPAYWFITYDPTGTAALVMTALLTILVSVYLGVHAARMEPRPEDRKQAEIAEGAGIRFARTRMPNDDPAFLEVLADVVRDHLVKAAP